MGVDYVEHIVGLGSWAEKLSCVIGIHHPPVGRAAKPEFAREVLSACLLAGVILWVSLLEMDNVWGHGFPDNV